MRPSRVLDGEGGDNAVGADQEEGAGAGGGGRRGLERDLEDVFASRFPYHGIGRKITNGRNNVP